MSRTAHPIRTEYMMMCMGMRMPLFSFICQC